MQTDSNDPTDNSPFHSGEQQLQALAGKRETMEKFGRRAIRSFMPDQHRQFYEQLPFLVVGSVDEQGWPWASIVSGKPGFISSPDDATLQVQANAVNGDPLGAAIKPGAPLGLLGIEPAARRRNRLNGRVSSSDGIGFTLSVDQSFGNCPQYIQSRSAKFVREPSASVPLENSRLLTNLDQRALEMIRNADTFFVSSYVSAQTRPEIEGVDVSHRGGRPGFVKVDGDVLTIPDYSGNYHFNTLGNFVLTPKAGLVFIDFEQGTVLMLTGKVELLPDNDPGLKAFKGAERGWRFRLHRAVRIDQALPFTLAFNDYSANTLITGDWNQADATLSAEIKRDQWRAFRVLKVVDESTVIRSFYLEPADGDGLASFEAGQFLTIEVQPKDSDIPVIRTYTVSSAPNSSSYRISVKRELGGYGSNILHDALLPGDIVNAKAPRGDFHLATGETRPVVLIAGGVGVTPMISMARHIVNEGTRTRWLRPVTVFHSSQTVNQRAFEQEFRALERESNNRLQYFPFASRVSSSDRPTQAKPVQDLFSGSGRITADVLRQMLALDDYDFYLCGPNGFMQALYDALQSLGVPDKRIFTESFGPASLARCSDSGAVNTRAAEPADEATEALITFSKSGFEQPWSAGDASLLETAEAHGLTPNFSCRKGICGACATRLTMGKIVYRSAVTASRADDEVLICCAVPAQGTDAITLEL